MKRTEQLARRVQVMAASAKPTIHFTDAFNRAWSRGRQTGIAVYYNVLLARGMNPMAWFDAKWKRLCA